MLKPKKIDALARLLEEMTGPGISHPKLVWLETIVVGSVIVVFVLVSMLIGVKLWYPSKFDALLVIVMCFLAILLLALLMAVFAAFFYTRWRRERT